MDVTILCPHCGNKVELEVRPRKPPGPQPVGFDSQLVRVVSRLYLSNIGRYSLQKIADALNEREIYDHGGKPWLRARLARVLARGSTTVALAPEDEELYKKLQDTVNLLNRSGE